MALWQSNNDTPPISKKGLANVNSGALCPSPRPISGPNRRGQLTYLTPGLVVSLCRRDLVLALVSAGCPHLATKIFSYLDSASLLACSLVCVGWQRLLLGSVYTTAKFRRRVRAAIFHARPRVSRLVLTLDQPPGKPASVVDVAIDDDFNIFALGMLGDRPHVMSCSLFGLGKKRWVHRFTESLDPTQLSCISAGQSLVALGLRDGRIYLYECSHQFRVLRLSAILAHHSGAIHGVVFSGGGLDGGGRGTGSNRGSSYIVTCSDDMTLGVVSILPNGSLLLSKLLHGHVSRVRAIDVQNGKIISGSDDRTVKLWSLRASTSNSSTSEKPLNTLTGHSGPVTCVQLSLPYALSAAGSTVRLWDVVQGTCLKLLQHDEDHHVTTMAWISTFKGVATVDSEGKLRCFDLYDLETANHEIVVASSMTRLQAEDEEDDFSSTASSCHSPLQSRGALTNGSGGATSTSCNGSPTSSSSSPTASGSESSPSSSSSAAPVPPQQPPPSQQQQHSPKQSCKFNGRNGNSLVASDAGGSGGFSSGGVVSCWPENAVFKLESIPHHFSAFSLANSPSPTITVHCLDYIL